MVVTYPTSQRGENRIYFIPIIIRYVFSATDLHGGLMEGIRALRTQAATDTAGNSVYDTYPMLIMLTDGAPSHGVTGVSEIRKLVREEIRGEMSLFTLGFGEDVDSTFLEQLALENQVQHLLNMIYVTGNYIVLILSHATSSLHWFPALLDATSSFV